MKTLVILFVLFCAALLQAMISIPEYLGGVSCPVLVGIVIYYGLTRTQGTALLVAFWAGLLQDALSPIPLGFSSFCYCVAVLIVNRFKDEVFISDWITHVLFGGCVNFGVTFISFVLLWQMQHVSIPPLALMVKLFGSLLWGCAVVPVVFYLTESLYRKLGVNYLENAI